MKFFTNETLKWLIIVLILLGFYIKSNEEHKIQEEYYNVVSIGKLYELDKERKLPVSNLVFDPNIELVVSKY